jgi:hypothetical protein
VLGVARLSESRDPKSRTSSSHNRESLRFSAKPLGLPRVPILHLSSLGFSATTSASCDRQAIPATASATHPTAPLCSRCSVVALRELLKFRRHTLGLERIVEQLPARYWHDGIRLACNAAGGA